MASLFSRKSSKHRSSQRLHAPARRRLALESLESRALLAVFANPAQILIPGSGTGGTTSPTGGAAAPYPSPITVSGLVGNITDVNVTLNKVNHTFPADMDILLVGPAGQNLLLASDAGLGGDAVNAITTFDDAATANVDNVAWVSGTFRPTNLGGTTADPFPAPAPASPYGSALSVFNGTNPNGVWNLYIVDDAGIDTGNITGGWSLRILTDASPEIDIQNFAGNSISDGDTAPTLAKFTDFGSVPVEGGVFTRTFTIVNTGTMPLNLTGNPRVQIGGANAADFTITAQPGNSTVAEGDTTTFRVTFNPSVAGTRAAFVKIANNDPDEPSYDFFIKGTGTVSAPEIDVRNFAGASIADGDNTPSLAKFTDFGSVAVTGGTFTRTFTIANTGTATLNLTGTPRVQIIGADAADFSVTLQPAATVAAGGTTTFRITFDPSASGSRAAIVKILNNDANEGSYDFFIKGTGQQAAPITAGLDSSPQAKSSTSSVTPAVVSQPKAKAAPLAISSYIPIPGSPATTLPEKSDSAAYDLVLQQIGLGGLSALLSDPIKG